MSTVADILTQVKAVAATAAPTWHELPYVHNVGANNFRTAKLAYGVRPMDASPTSSVNRVYTMDHRFEMVLTDSIARAADDSQIETTLGVLYGVADTIFKAMVNTAINLPSVVLMVSQPSLSEPEMYEKEKFVALRMQFVVKYRSTLT